jgi:hypothetical protein
VVNPDRAIGVILAACVAAVLLLGGSLLWRAHAPPPAAPTAPPTATPTETARATPTGDLPEAARRYRLAGTVAGGVSYAILEGPGGQSDLLQPGEVVRGLGQVIAIGEDSITIEGDAGRFELRVAPAPTVTVTPTPRLQIPTPVPPLRARTTPGSSPSAAPDQPAS